MYHFGWDIDLLKFFVSWTNHNRLFDLLSIFLANYLVYVFVGILAIYFFIGKPKRSARHSIVVALASFIVARLLVVQSIRAIWPRLRPVDLGFVPHPIVNMASKISEPSFPSGHASAMFAIASVIYLYDRRLGIWLYVMSVLTGIFRIVIGVHYPLDIIAGTFLGIITGLATNKLLSKPLSKASDDLLNF